MTTCVCGYEYEIDGRDKWEACSTHRVTCPACGHTAMACVLWPGWPFTAPPEPTEEQKQASKERTRKFWQKYHQEREEMVLEILMGNG